MENFESINMLIPHNLPGGELGVKAIKKLINTAIELGGTVYEIAEDSGLLSAYNFLERHFGEQEPQENELNEDITVLTEVYVHEPESEEPERIFLYSDNARRDAELKEEGCIQGGKLIIEYDSLKAIRDKGYGCIWPKTGGTGEGTTSNRFKDIFGNKQKEIPFKLWNNDSCFVGNGFNQVLLVRTFYGTVFVTADIYAVRESVKAFYAENLIREKYDASFSIERIQPDKGVMKELENVRFLLFGRGKLEEYQEFRDSYQKLTCQIAYIKIYYQDVYETVWNDEFEPDDENTKIGVDEEAELGISFRGFSGGFNGSFAVCQMEDGSIKRVPNMHYSYDTPLCQKYEFEGYGDSMNPGVAGSRMALLMKKIIRSAEFMLGVVITKVYVTHIDELPTCQRFSDSMQIIKKAAEENGNAETRADLIAYKEVEDKNLDGLGMIKWAAELAEISQMEYVDPVTAIVNAYEKKNTENCLKDNEIALLYNFNEDELVITIVRKHENEKLEVMNQKKTCGSESVDLFSQDEDGCRCPSIRFKELEDALENFMMNAGLRVLGIYDGNEAEAFEELRNSAPRVKRQFRRNDTAKVIFNGIYLTMVEDYPIEQFEEIFKPILKRNEKILRDVLNDAGLCMTDIAKVYLTGTESEYPFVRKNIEEITNQKVCCVNAPECVAARGAVLS